MEIYMCMALMQQPRSTTKPPLEQFLSGIKPMPHQPIKQLCLNKWILCAQ